MSHILTVTLDGATHTIDVDRLTFAEGRAVERVTGQTLGDVMTHMSLTAVQALTWVAIKRDQPELKFSDLDDRAISDVGLDVKQDEEPDPTQPAAAG
jgi:hypothetical protein